MRDVVYSLTASLDGYINRLDGALDWISTDVGVPIDEFFKEKFSAFDAVIIGRKSYDTMIATPGPNAYPGMTNYVVSRNLPPGKRNGFEFISGDLTAWVAGLKNKPGKRIWLSGGGELARSFLDLGLVDRIDLSIQPILLGEGIPLFPAPFPETKLKLESARTLNKIIELKYTVVR